MRVLHALKRYLALERADRWLLLRAWVVLGLTDIRLRALGFQRVVERVQPPSGRVLGPGESCRAHRYARWLEIASRHHVVRARCLHRSLALHHWLRREGLPSELRIGARKDGGALKAHAWVELEGRVVNDPPAAVAAFTPLASPSGQRPAWNGG